MCKLTHVTVGQNEGTYRFSNAADGGIWLPHLPVCLVHNSMTSANKGFLYECMTLIRIKHLLLDKVRKCSFDEKKKKINK